MVDLSPKKRAARFNATPTLIALSLLGTGLSAHAAEPAAKLDDIVVTATGFQQKAKNAAASISVITQKQLENKAYHDVTDALKDVPGVVVTGGGSTSDISIRGMASGYTLIMVDGKRVDSRGTRPNSDGSGIEQGWLPPVEAIQRIEVIRGPMSALYGSDAMGGVINIITKKTTQGEWRTSIRSDVTIQEDNKSGNQYQTNLFTTGPIVDGLLGMRANALISQRDEDKALSGYSEQKMRSGGITFTLTPNDDNDIDLEFSRSLQDRNANPGKSIAAESCNKKGVCEPNSPSESRYERTQYSLSHTGRYDNINTSSYIQREENNNPGRQMVNNNTIFNTQTQTLLGNHSLTIGGQYKYEELKDQGNKLTVTDPVNRLTRYNWSVFAEDQWQIVPTFALTTALRLDKDENFGSHVTPKLYGVWQANQNWTVKGGVSAGYKTPSLRAASPDWGQATGGGTSDGMIIGNAGLQPEKSLTTELGFIWDNQDNLEIGATLFNNDFKDKITESRVCNSSADPLCTFQGHTYDFISERINVDKANIRGLEATLYWALSETLSLDANYTYTRSKQKSGQFEGRALNKMPKHMANATLDWQAKERLSFWTRVNFRGKTSEYQSRTSMADGTPSYAFVDLGLSYQPQKNVNIVAGVYNIMDKEVKNATYGATLDGRRYNLGLTYKF